MLIQVESSLCFKKAPSLVFLLSLRAKDKAYKNMHPLITSEVATLLQLIKVLQRAEEQKNSIHFHAIPQ